MNKNDLIEELAKQAGISKQQAQGIVDAFVVTIKDALKKSEKVMISGLGTFMLAKRQGYTGKNPQTGQKVEIPTMIFPYFKVSRVLKESIK
ncbi:hypothetical protein A3F08_01585 [Candidatus Berkelbacteria bacterium RIFCSPHIGHO2_12_FULL_36_9]|uniref:DNA-binding protein n=1 Tax=Candidatus Berkelbacteria bacterium RIFCSPHIGHO2_12_FULL_36_9 TaxID=1797469 RepID=A0A1F5EKJ3_9BACT|nr:MAG: hypothetical protein A3F08_01585 [Candidatus Berkelbacteria bacterium RIFCSPHIGHO2_12_FULL_36_9]